MSQVDRFRRQAVACAALGSPLYEALLTRAADDLAAGGVTAELLADHADAPAGAAVSLRLMGAVHRLVLARQAPALAIHYPSVGGTYTPGDPATDADVWAAFRQVLVDRPDAVRETLTRPPQTNEPGRSLPLIGGLAVVARRSGGRPVRLVEIGASAGLNLRAEQLLPVHRPTDVATLPSGPAYDVTDRLGCDLDPLDPTTTDGRLTLSSYVWPDDLVRFERLRRALEVAAAVPAVVLRRGAADLLRDVRPVAGEVTVLWHSVMWQYLDDAERSAVLAERDRLAEAATPTEPFAHLTLEPNTDDGAADFDVRLRWSVGGPLSDELLGTAPPHGVPVTWG